MKKIIITVLLVVALISCSLFETPSNGSTNKNSNNTNVSYSKTVTVAMIEKRDSVLVKKTVVLSDTSEYSFSTYFNKFISSYPFGSYGYDQFQQKAIQDTLSHDTLRMENYIMYKLDGEYTLAYHLEHGSCFIYDKKSNEIIRSIDVEYFRSGVVGAFIEGRRFYIKGKLILDVADKMS